MINQYQRAIYSFGPKIAYYMCSLGFPDDARYANGDYSKLSGLVLGLAGKVNITPKVFMQTEFSYLRKQSEADPVVTGTRYVTICANLEPVEITSKVKFDLRYLDWPFYVGYYILNGKARPFVGAGVNMGFLLSGEIEDDPYTLDPKDDGPPFYKFNNFDFGLLGILGGDLLISDRSYLQFYIKYVLSETDYTLYRNGPIPGGDGMGSSNLTTSRLQISISYFYSPGRKK